MILNLRKNVNYRIAENKDGEITVDYGDGTRVSSQKVTSSGVKSSANVVAYSDECVPLFDGKILLRLRNALSVVESN